jgi:O-antigen/teichoic acid export membrane protein
MTAIAASLGQRVLRTTTITALGLVASQAIRLAGNLVLTRLLFPEAFGLMALVSVFFMGLVMLSDIGIGAAIMQSRRGDDPDFLDTAWTVQILRGLLLWALAVALSPLFAWFYDEPDLRALLFVTAFGLLFTAFRPTRLETANRHMRVGLITLIDLSVQVAGLVVTVALAWALRSVWAMVISGLVTSALHLAILHLVLPGHRNRLRWERGAASELIHFGKWIFLATLSGFVVGQADKVILGRYLDLDEFGFYNIAIVLASVPLMIGAAVSSKVLIPIYRDAPPGASAANAARVRRMRTKALAALLLMSALFAFGGPALVELLYDPRYQAAAGIVVLVAVTQVPALMILTCDLAALAGGDSQRFFWLTLTRAVLVTTGLLLGLEFGGLAGAVVGQGLGNLLSYPVLAWVLKPHGAWDPALDAKFLAAGTVMGALALWLNEASLMAIP